MKILQFCVVAAEGGCTQYILNLWRKIDRTRFHFDFVTFSKELNFANELEREGSKIHYMPAYPENNEGQFIVAFNRALDCGYDIIEIHTSFWKSTIVEEVAKKRGVKVIVHSHSTGITKAKNWQEHEKMLKQHNIIKKRIDNTLIDYFWACSKDAANWLYGEQISPNIIEIINNAIDTKRFSLNQKKRREMRKHLNLEGKYVVGFAGRFEWVKNLEFILKLLPQILQRCPQAYLLLVGDGSFRKSLERQIAELHLEERVYITGRQPMVENFYQAMDVFVLPSFFEGFPLVTLEAQCSGLKCICSDKITSDIVLSDDTVRVSVEEPLKWIEEILKWSNGYERSDKSRLLTDKGFDIYMQVKKMENKYLECYD